MALTESTPADKPAYDGPLYDPVTAPNAPNIVPPDPYDEPAEPERVDVDTLIERPDLGEGATTLVAAGDPVPANLAHLPRRVRDEVAKPRKARPPTVA
jgi:hypothetical protein